METLNNDITLAKFFTGIRLSWKTYLLVFFISAIISSLIILPIPRYYQCNISLAPEMDSNDGLGKAGSIASSFGINIGAGMSSNALQPSIYPDLMKSNVFIVKLLPINIKTKDDKIHTTFYDYLSHYYKKSIYTKIVKGVTSIFRNDTDTINVRNAVNPFRLTKEQNKIFELIKGNIKCDIDIKTDLINISVIDQDPVVAATIADSVRAKLQDFITEYKTTKAKNDVKYYAKLVAEAKEKYERSRQLYAAYSDANQDVLLRSYQSKTEDLENDMQLRFNTYSALSAQLQSAQAKVQEHTPSFTIVQSASVPVKPAGPKRMAFVFIITFMSLLITLVVKNKELFFGKA